MNNKIGFIISVYN